jgi:hypothetical protein
VTIETRMAIHIAALKADWEQPGSYKEFTRRALEQVKTPSELLTIVALADLPAGAGKNRRPEPIPISRLFGSTRASERSARPMRPRLPINIAAKSISPSEQSLRERLEVVAHAWDEFQSSCSRDAIYPFLQRVFSLVERYEKRGRRKRLLRNILKLTGFKADADTNVYSLVIRSATGSDDVDRKQTSKLSRVLRFAAEFKSKRVSLRAFIQARGGLNEVAALYARRLGRHRNT